MIVVKVEMWPGGDGRKAYEFARAYIANEAVTTQQTGGKLGDYSVKLYGGVSGRLVNLARPPWRVGTVSSFNRSVLGAWHLIYLALKETLGRK